MMKYLVRLVWTILIIPLMVLWLILLFASFGLTILQIPVWFILKGNIPENSETLTTLYLDYDPVGRCYDWLKERNLI